MMREQSRWRRNRQPRSGEVTAVQVMTPVKAWGIRLLSFGLAMVAPGNGDAQAVHGDYGARSQATFRISVSVAPRFQGSLSTSLHQNEPPANGLAGLTRFASNAPSLRYSLLVYPAPGREGAPSTSDPVAPRHETEAPRPKEAKSEALQANRASVLILIVPD